MVTSVHMPQGSSHSLVRGLGGAGSVCHLTTAHLQSLPPKYGRPSCTSGVAMVASDVGEHAMPLTLLAL